MHCVRDLMVLLLLPCLLSVKADSRNCVEFWTTQQAGATSLIVRFQQSCYSPDILETVAITNVASPGKPSVRCQFLHSSDGCTQTIHFHNCSCDNNNRTYTVTFTPAADGSTDEWEVLGKVANSGQEIKDTVTLRHGDAARVEDIVITVKGSRGQPVEQGDIVTLTCIWHPGNPPHTAAFFDESNSKLVSHVINHGHAKQIEHVIYGVQCKHSGRIRCEAAGASVNKSHVLLVKCAPNFQQTKKDFSVLDGANLTADFEMRAHTDSVSSWTLQQLPPHNTEDSVKREDLRSRGRFEIQGTPPSLTARLTLRDVTASDEGRWRLEVANDVGNGQVDFQLTVSQDLGSPVSYVVLGVVGCTLLVLIPAAVGVGYRCRRKGAPLNTADIALPPLAPVSGSPTSPQPAHRPLSKDDDALYVDIDDADDDGHSMLRAPSPAPQPEVTSLHSSSSSHSQPHTYTSLHRRQDGDRGSCSDGYLHPTASADEKSA